MHTQSRSSLTNQRGVGVAGGGHSGEGAWVGGGGVERWHWKQNNGCSNYFRLCLLNSSFSLFAICCDALWRLYKHDVSTTAARQRKKSKSIPGQRSPQWRTQDQLITLQTRCRLRPCQSWRFTSTGMLQTSHPVFPLLWFPPSSASDERPGAHVLFDAWADPARCDCRQGESN